jgi:YkoY family integral membrane protein
MTSVSAGDLLLVVFLAFLEGLLSLDNAIVLAMMAKPLPREQQRKALTYGLAGSVVFRLAALAIASRLIYWRLAKILGGAYLLFVAGRFALYGRSLERKPLAKTSPNFWKTVVLIEMMDLAFAVDSILAAVALTPKFWIVFTGGMLGVVMMRFAATLFISILKKFPRFERTAYELVALIGLKLLVDSFRFPGVHFEWPGSIAFWVFWCLMILSIALGIMRRRA